MEYCFVVTFYNPEWDTNTVERITISLTDAESELSAEERSEIAGDRLSTSINTHCNMFDLEEVDYYLEDVC